MGAPGASLSATRIGVTAAVNPDASGRAPDVETRILRVGTDNFADERITTGPSGQAQLLFLDGASLSIGPNAEVMLDRFAYDPQGRLGQLKLEVTRGVLRFVGGAISKASEVEITTPVATVGVRGGIVLLNQQPDAPLIATLLYGQHMAVSAGGATETVLRPGYRITVAAGQVPSAPAPAPLAELRAELSALQGAKPADRGGGAEPSPDAALARSAVSSATGSALAAAQLVATSAATEKVTESVEETARRITERAAIEAREGVDFGRFLTIFDYLDRDLRGLPRINSNGIFGDRLLVGYVGGVMDTTMPNGTTSSATITPGSLAVLFLDAVRYRVVGDFFVSTGDCCFDFTFGGEGRNNRGRSVYLAQNIFAARNSVTNPSVFADTGTAAVPLASRAVMVSADALNITVPGATPCECRFMSWGYWVGAYQQPSGRVDLVNLGTWVTGRLPDPSEVPQTGSAIYTGQTVGNVVTPAGVHYLAGGSFQMVWDFARRSGTATIGNFDGITVRGASSSANGRDYTGSLAGSAGGTGFTGSLAGSFYKSAVGPVTGAAGNFAFASAAGYKAGGTFLARR